ncbi:unnamed protein product [Heterobilharzia americana]|nr:unnamed protein product [Heterobilharzia americana]
MGYVNNDTLTIKDNVSLVYPELYSNQYEFNASISCYLDNFYGKGSCNTINEKTYVNNTDSSLDENGVQSLIHHINEKNNEETKFSKLKNNFHPKLSNSIKPPVKLSLSTFDENTTNDAISSTSRIIHENSSFLQSMYRTHCMKEYQKTDLDLSLSSSSIETSGSEINEDSMFPIKSNVNLSHLHLTRQINNDVF